MHWLWGLPEGMGQGQPLPVFCKGPFSISYKVICRWLLLVLGLEVPRRDQTVNPSQMLLVLGLGPLARGTGYMEARCYLFERFLGKSEA